MRVMVPCGESTVAGDGAYNMALDKVLFENFDEADGPLLRFYCFHPPTITIPIRYNGDELCTQKIRESNVRISRRISGGKYLLHQLGLTYSIFLPKNHFMIDGLSLRDSYRNISLPLFLALRSLNETVEFLKCKTGVFGKYDCSMETEVESMGVKGLKFVGAAQKRGKQVVIQHGEIQLLSSPLGLGHFFTKNLDNSTVGLDPDINLTNFKTSPNLVCKPRPTAKGNFETLNRLREKVASNILVEFEKVLGERRYYQLESSLIDQAMEFREQFEIVLK